MEIHFYKYQGTGNDFIMIDNRLKKFPAEDKNRVALLCDRRFGIGADGLILLENDENHDFRMIYFNSDGNESSMCGNGGRCIVAFAKKLGIIERETSFIATDGVHFAEISDDDFVNLQMKSVSEIEVFPSHIFLNTGSPHHIQLVDNQALTDVKKEGSQIRYNEFYSPKGGTNVNFVTQLSENSFAVSTYERGVEDETLSCGTGVTAVALAMFHTKKTTEKSVFLQTKGGDLKVIFDVEKGNYFNIFLCGKASFVFEGTIFL